MSQVISGVASQPRWMFIRIKRKRKRNYVFYRFKFYQKSKKPHSFMQTLTFFWRKSNLAVFVLVSTVCYGLGSQPYNFIRYKRGMASRRPVETFVLRRKRKIIIKWKLILYLSDEILGSKNNGILYIIKLFWYGVNKTCLYIVFNTKCTVCD